MRTNYKSSNQNSSVKYEKPVASQKGKVDDDTVSNNEVILSRDKKVEAFMCMVDIALERKKSLSGKKEEKGSSEEIKINSSNVKKPNTNVVAKPKKKFPIVAIILSLLIGGATGYLISNMNAKSKMMEINGDPSIVSEYKSRLDELYVDEEKTDISDNVSMEVLSSIGTELNNDSVKLGNNLNSIKGELVDIASYIGYREDLIRYKTNSLSLMSDDFMSFYDKAYKEASGYSTVSLREAVLGSLNRIFSLRNSYISIESNILRFGLSMDIDESVIALSIDNVTNELDKNYLSSLLNYVKAKQNVNKAELNLKSATDTNKTAMQKALTEAKYNLDKAKENLDNSVNAQSGKIVKVDSSDDKENSMSENDNEISNNEESSGKIENSNAEISKSN